MSVGAEFGKMKGWLTKSLVGGLS